MFLILLCDMSENDKDLINRIFIEHNQKLYHISRKMLQNDDDAQDAVAQTFLKIMEHIEKIGDLPCPQIAPYCVVIVKHVSADILRQRKRVVCAENPDVFAGGEESDVESRFFENADRARLLAAVQTLSKEDRYLIHLHYAQDLGYREIAQLLETSEETAKKRGQRVLRKLRKLYEEDGHGG